MGSYGQLCSASAELQPFLWMALRCIERSLSSPDWITAKPMDTNYSKEATGFWTALKQLRRNRISQNDVGCDAASERAQSPTSLTAGSRKLLSVLKIIKAQ